MTSSLIFAKFPNEEADWSCATDGQSGRRGICMYYAYLKCTFLTFGINKIKGQYIITVPILNGSRLKS